MESAPNDTRYLAELQNLEAILQEMGFQTRLLQKSATIPTHALVARVRLPQDQKPIEMALSFYPIEDHTIQHSMLLQYFIELPISFDAEAQIQLRQLLPDLNYKSVLGHFGLADGSSAAHYRYVQTLPADQPVTKAAVADVIVLVSYTPALFFEILTALSHNALNAESARKQLQARYQT